MNIQVFWWIICYCNNFRVILNWSVTSLTLCYYRKDVTYSSVISKVLLLAQNVLPLGQSILASWFTNPPIVIFWKVGKILIIIFLFFLPTLYILRKTIEGYLDTVPFLTFNTIKTKLIMHAFHSSRYLQLKLMFALSHASMIEVQYISKWCIPLYWKVTSNKKWLTPFLSFAFP